MRFGYWWALAGFDCVTIGVLTVVLLYRPGAAWEKLLFRRCAG
jgi:hypothetical protein